MGGWCLFLEVKAMASEEGADALWTRDGDETSWAEWAEARAGAPATPFVSELIQAHPAPSPRAWALDLGCGTGRALSPLAEAGYRVAGLDATARAVELCRERARAEPLPAWPIRASAAALPLRDGCASFVLAIASLFHLTRPELESALAEVRRVLSPGGEAVLHFLDIRDWRRSLAPGLTPEAETLSGYSAVVTCFCSQPTLEGWLQVAGLKVRSLDLRVTSSPAGEQRDWIAICTRGSLPPTYCP